MGFREKEKIDDTAIKIDQLNTTLATSTNLDDLQEAAQSLLDLAEGQMKLVGERSIGTLFEVLTRDERDSELLSCVLSTILVLIDETSVEDSEFRTSEQQINASAILEEESNVSLLLDTLKETSVHIRLHTLNILKCLLKVRTLDVQTIILSTPMGVGRLVDMVRDKRDVVRNEGLLFLHEMCESNAEIQKIVTFEEIFDTVLSIVEEEGFSDGGIIVIDCLALIRVLLEGTDANQNFFRENNCIQRMRSLIACSLMQELADSDSDIKVPVSSHQLGKGENLEAVLSEDVQTIILATFDLLKLLASGTEVVCRKNKQVIGQCGMVAICNAWAFHAEAPLVLRHKARSVLARLMEGSVDNAAIFRAASNLQVTDILSHSLDELTLCMTGDGQEKEKEKETCHEILSLWEA